MSRRRGSVEIPEYLGAARRFIRAAGVRVADADPVDLAAMLQLEGALAEALQTAVDGQRARGFSWAEIGVALGVSKQAAYQRWGKS